jgi:hypothetical protein
MSTLVLRSVKGSPLTSSEIDANVTNLNNDKADKASPTFTGAVTLPNSLVQVTASTYPTVQPTLNLDFANSKTVDPRITFVRNSTATYYDGQTTAKAEENLLLNSQLFNSGWVPTNLIRTSGITAPDNSSTAFLLYPSTTAGGGLLYQPSPTFASGIYTLSIYAQAAGKDFLAFLMPNNIGAGSVWFNLSTGAVSTTSGTYTASIVNVTGTTWYRCSIVSLTAISGVFAFTVTDANGSLAITTSGTNGINIWGAQLEQRSSVTAYTPTTTSPITNYIPVLMTAPAGVPRLDYNPTTGVALGLLIEESRTNLLTYSRGVGGTGWYNQTITPTTNALIAPDGTLTGSLLVAPATNFVHYTANLQAVTSGVTYTISFYVKQQSRRYFTIADANGLLGNNPPTFDFNTKAVVTSGAYTNCIMVDVGDGWYRASVTGVASSSGTCYATVAAQVVPSGGFGGYLGDGYSGIYIWGAQLEQGSFATSYIPTVATTITRAVDVASMTGVNFSSWYNQMEGTMYCDFTEGYGFFPTAASIDGNGTYDNRFQISRYSATATATSPVAVIYSPSVIQLSASIQKIAASYTSTLISAGSNINAGTSVVLSLIKPVMLGIGSMSGNQLILNGHIRKITYYPVALSSSSLVALTS